MRLPQLQAQLRQSAGPDLKQLGEILARFDSGHDGLELRWFLDVRRALHNYLATAYAVGNKAIRGEYEKTLDKLAKGLDAYAVKPTTDEALRISEEVRWLEAAHQVPDLLADIHERLVHPNIVCQVSPAVLAAAAAGPVDDCRCVHDCILGTDIQATAHTTGETSVELPADPNFGVMDTLFFGTTCSTSVGYNGPVTIFSTSTTDLAARKRLWFDPASGLAAHEAASRADTSICIGDIQSNKGRRIVERMAWKRAGQQQSQAEGVASRHAEARLNEQMDQQAAESIERANRDYVNKIRSPLSERELFPGRLQASTTPEAILLVGVQASGGKLAAPGTRPPSPREPT